MMQRPGRLRPPTDMPRALRSIGPLRPRPEKQRLPRRPGPKPRPAEPRTSAAPTSPQIAPSIGPMILLQARFSALTPPRQQQPRAARKMMPMKRAKRPKKKMLRRKRTKSPKKKMRRKMMSEPPARGLHVAQIAAPIISAGTYRGARRCTCCVADWPVLLHRIVCCFGICVTRMYVKF